MKGTYLSVAGELLYFVEVFAQLFLEPVGKELDRVALVRCKLVAEPVLALAEPLLLSDPG